MDLAISELSTPEELSDLLKIPKETLYQWRHRGKGPKAIRIGKHIRYRRADVVEWLDERAAAS